MKSHSLFPQVSLWFQPSVFSSERPFCSSHYLARSSRFPSLRCYSSRLTMVESTRFTQARQIQDNPEVLKLGQLAKEEEDEDDSMKKINPTDKGVFNNEKPIGLKLGTVGEKAHNDFFKYFSALTPRGRRHLAILLGTTISWFCTDIFVYGINLNSSVILKQINFTTGRGVDYHHKAYSSLMRTATGNLIVSWATRNHLLIVD